MTERISQLSSPNRQNALNSPVIAFGGSHGGVLAYWMRFKYPSMVYGENAHMQRNTHTHWHTHTHTLF